MLFADFVSFIQFILDIAYIFVKSLRIKVNL